MKSPVYLAVHVPEFPAQALLRLRPELLRQPVVVMKGTPPVQQVCSLNAPARAMGLEAGLTRAQLEPFQGLHMLPASTSEEESAMNALIEAAAFFTPRVEPQLRGTSAFCMVLDLSNTSLIWGEITTSIRRVAQSIRRLRMTARLAASSNAMASVCLAAVPQREPLVIAPGQESAALARLPLSALSLSPDQAETLSLWGLRSLGDLAALPVHAVVARTGQAGKRLHALASGTHSHLLVPQEQAFLLEETMEFDQPVEMLESLLFVLGPMLDQLIRRAANRSYALASVTTRLVLDGGGEHMRTVRPALPTSERTPLLKLMQLDLQAHPPSAGITALHVSAETGDRSRVQFGLFAPQMPESMQLDVTLARIAAMVGADHVGCARLVDTHHDRSFVMERFTVDAPPASGRTSGKNSAQNSHEMNEAVRGHAAAVLRRCRPPVPLRVSTQSQQPGKRPRSFYLHGKLYTVAECFGPWRQSGDWWSSTIWSREEWDVSAQHEGSAVLLAVLQHDLLRKTWTLEALYD